jgi:SAM-dependent methyltransferase
MNDETRAVAERYARRGSGDLYSALRPEVWQIVQERERALLRCLARRAASGGEGLADWRLVEVGCGRGDNLLHLLQLGFAPEHLLGLELLEDRHAAARHRLPTALPVWPGDASVAPVPAASQDFVLASTVFSSLLDDAFQQRLADAMWSWLKPGGAVLWYDFTFDNPRNPDVRGVPLRRLRELFAAGRVEARRVTLAPPMARAVCAVHPALYRVLNVVPLLRTHLFAVVHKP